MCLYPRLLPNKKYTETKKNRGNIPSVSDIRVLRVPVGCGKCMECRKKRARDWQVRLMEEVKRTTDRKFVTLTFSNESIKQLAALHPELEGYKLDNAIATTGVRKFLERWRKEHKTSVKHWLVTELGHNGTENIHLHGIIWTDKSIDHIEKHWQYGFMHKDNRTKNFVSERTVNYIVKYIMKADSKHPGYEAKVLTSKGIGRGYEKTLDGENNKYKEDGTTKDQYRLNNGRKVQLPIYYRNKIYTEEEREKLWLEKLDKNERWVGGEKIAADDEKTYYQLLDYYRKINKELGYGDNKKDWRKEQYELERRILLTKKRIEGA